MPLLMNFLNCEDFSVSFLGSSLNLWSDAAPTAAAPLAEWALDGQKGGILHPPLRRIGDPAERNGQ